MSKEKPEGASETAPATGRSMTALTVRTFVVICVIAGFSFHLYLQCIKYMNDPSIAVSETSLRKSLFPDVTYCFPTYFNAQRLLDYKYQKRYNYMTDIFYKNLKTLWNYIQFNITHESSLSLFQKNWFIYPAMSTLLPHMAMNLVGGGVQDNLLECRFYGKKCDFLNFTSFWDGQHGLCFQFSPQNATIPGGIKNGLSLLMHYKFSERVDVEEIYGNTKVFVHPRNTYGTAEQVSGLGQVGKMLNIEYVYVYMNKLNTAIIPCRPVENLILCRMEVLRGLVCRSYKETDNVRKQVGLQIGLEERCNCISYEWPIPGNLRNRTACHFMPEEAYLHRGVQADSTGELSILPVNTSANPIPLSDILNITELRLRAQCYAEFKRDIAKGMITIAPRRLCNPETCKLTILEENGPFFLVGQMVYGQRFYDIIKKNALDLIQKIENYNLTTVLLGRMGIFLKVNMMKLFSDSFYSVGCIINIFPNEIAGRVSKEYFLYDLLYFIADMGGVTGLWVGMSIVTIFEIVEWIIWKITRKCRGKQESPK